MMVHGTTVDIAGAGVLLLGAPGAGKSDLALRLIGEGALLVADDQTDIIVEGGAMLARAPLPLAGLLEVRGIGIVHVPVKRATRLALAVSLVRGGGERMPEDAVWVMPDTQEAKIRHVVLDPFEVSAAAKVRQALAGRLMGRDAG